MNRLRGLWLLSGLLTILSAAGRAADLPALWGERVKSVAAVDYYTQTEAERRLTTAYGVAIDRAGTIILPSAAIDSRASLAQLRDFRVYLAGDGEGHPATYLGQDAFTGWHYVRADPATAARLVPLSTWRRARRPLALGQHIWGIGLRTKDEDFTPYLLTSHIALVQRLPQETAIAQQEVAGPGLPVFDDDGQFVGLAVSSFGQTYLQFSRVDRDGTPIMLVDLEESSAFLTAGEILPYLNRIPTNPTGRPLAWLGAAGFQAMGRDVAEYLKIPDRSGVVVSEVLENSPAQRAGLQSRDIIIAFDGKPLPRFTPQRVVTEYLEREIDRHRPGDVVALTVMRGGEQVQLRATLEDAPKLAREAQRRFFDTIGMSVREFVYGDAIERRIKVAASGGVIVAYVKPNSPAAAAGLQPDDWIQEIDGAKVQGFAAAAAKLAALASDSTRSEFVVLAARGSDTAILRIKLR